MGDLDLPFPFFADFCFSEDGGRGSLMVSGGGVGGGGGEGAGGVTGNAGISSFFSASLSVDHIQ